MLPNWDRVVRILEAVFFATLKKFLVLLRHNRTIALMVRVLSLAMRFLSSFLVVVVILWLAFVVWGNLSFGRTLGDFSNIPSSMYTPLRIALGDFYFHQFEDGNRILGPI